MDQGDGVARRSAAVACIQRAGRAAGMTHFRRSNTWPGQARAAGARYRLQVSGIRPPAS
jgi:hypothetical protein